MALSGARSSGRRSGETPLCKKSLAFLAGQAMAQLSNDWKPRGKVSETDRPVVRSGIADLDGALRLLRLPCPPMSDTTRWMLRSCVGMS